MARAGDGRPGIFFDLSQLATRAGNAMPPVLCQEFNRIWAGRAFAARALVPKWTMLRLSSGQRGFLAGTLGELANLVVGAMVLGQFVGSEPWSIGLSIVGGALWLSLLAMAIGLKGND
jgi:hypothetical protein